MESEKPTSKRAQHARRPSKPPLRLAREKRSQPLAGTTASKSDDTRAKPDKIRVTKNSVDITRRMQEDETALQSSAGEEDAAAKSYRVANVGAGGRLYLKPRRAVLNAGALSPVSPSFSTNKSITSATWDDNRRSVTSDTWSLAQDRNNEPQNTANSHSAGVDDRRRRTIRSNSFSGIGDRDHLRPPLASDRRAGSTILDHSASDRPEKMTPWPKNVTDFSRALLDLPIPHYRLGTPFFSDMGAAYIRGSMYSTTTYDRSSVISHLQKPLRASQYDAETPRASLRTIRELRSEFNPSAMPTTGKHEPFRKNATVVTPALYDEIEKNPNDPAIVQYHLVTRNIVAATAGRLVAEITSPRFLDYELLSDFFLTFRSFMFAADLLEYLLARLRWSLNKSTDARRIVRVRTFVALRHWILNYFADDFLPNHGLRQRFCDIVNDITNSMRDSQEPGRMRMSIIGELKKCWRRTCATFWPIPDAMETSANAKIWPGGDLAPAPIPRPETLSLNDDLPTPLFQTRAAQEQAAAAVRGSINRVFQGEMTPLSFKHTSFPTSPMSEDSLHVLSCSVPFLRNVRPPGDPLIAQPARLPSQQRVQALAEKPGRVSHQHKRSSSFTDALRDSRAHPTSPKDNGIDLTELPAIAFTGGLIRGLLLKPSPPEFKAVPTVAPAVEPPMVRFADNDNEKGSEKSSQAGVRKLVGEVKRALSTRRGPPESIGEQPSRATQPSNVSRAIHHVRSESAPRPSAWSHFRGPVRTDVLGERAAEAYEQGIDATVNMSDHHDFADNTNRFFYSLDRAMQDELPKRTTRQVKRLNSTFTSGSQSIVIMDATGGGIFPRMSSSAPELSMWSLNGRYARSRNFGKETRLFSAAESDVLDLRYLDNRDSPSLVRNVRDRETNYGFDVLRNQGDNGETTLGRDLQAAQRIQARKSSSAYPNGVAIPFITHGLRRRPGGDLRAIDHVRELETSGRQGLSGSHSMNHSSRYTDLLADPTNVDAAESEMFEAYPGLTKKDESFALLDTHSSMQGLRPSLEAQVSQLATLPDEFGGVQDALLKLEGKSPIDSHFNDYTVDPTIPLLDRMRALDDVAHGSDSASYHGNVEALPTMDNTVTHQDVNYPNDFRFPADPGAEDQEDGTTIRERPHSMPAAVPGLQIDPGDTIDVILDDRPIHKPVNEPIDPSTASQSGDAGGLRGTITSNLTSHAPDAKSQLSFLLDDNESLSDISTALGDELDYERAEEGMGSFSFDDTAKEMHSPRHMDLMLPAIASDTSPTTGGSRKMHGRSNTVGHSSEFSGYSSNQAIHLPKLPSPNLDRNAWPMPPSSLKQPISIPQSAIGKHLPFVLLFEPEVIAKQLTIIEKDALDEIDWQDLITMKWRQHFPIIRNWASFLRVDGCSGVDLVVARFNLAVKWVVSECILTESSDERARAIKRFIRIAHHCRRLRNYASMYQITLGLLSTDLTRLRRTWAMIGPADKRLLFDLETLCQPVRNFRNLRAEMESGSPDEGCIPFIGLYTHDLMHNAQKPTRIDSPFARDEPIINFERFQTTAGIVKGLLRLIEASSKYTFQPHPEALSRCLWLAALEDREIASRSRTIEP